MILVVGKGFKQHNQHPYHHGAGGTDPEEVVESERVQVAQSMDIQQLEHVL